MKYYKLIGTTITALLGFIPGAHATTPIRHVKLQGDFYQMGIQYANRLGDDLTKQLTLSHKNLRPKTGNPETQIAFEDEVEKVVAAAKVLYPQPIMDFIKGEADSAYAKNNNLKIDDFVYLDQNILISSIAAQYSTKASATVIGNCSFIGIQKPNTVVGRNYDWLNGYLPTLTKYPVITEITHADKSSFPNTVVIVGNPGVISSITIANDKGLFIAINSAVSSVGNFKVWDRENYFSNALLTMMRANDFDDLSTWVEHEAPNYGYIVNIASPDKMASIEVSPYNELQGHYDVDMPIPEGVFTTRVRRPTDNATVTPHLDRNKGLLVATNTFRLLGWEPYLGHEVPSQTSTFSQERYHNLIARGREVLQEGGPQTLKQIKDVMSYTLNTKTPQAGATEILGGSDERYSSNPDSTYYTVIYDTKNRLLGVRFQQYNDNSEAVWTPWHFTKVGS